MFFSFSEETDLELDRVLFATPETVWRCWTDPALFKKWFSPHPAVVEDVRLDLRPGGEFYTRMRSPKGKVVESTGCFLALSPERMIAYTDALGPGFHPRGKGFLTTVVLMSADVTGTRYITRALHATPEQKQKHEEMGFRDGWGRVISQLGDLAQQIDR